MKFYRRKRIKPVSDRMKLIKECDSCKNVFEIKNWNYKQKYCSRKCYAITLVGKSPANKKEKIKLVCKVCGKEYFVIPSRGKSTCCSRKCAYMVERNLTSEARLKMSLSRKGHIGYMKGKKHTENTKLKMSAAHKGKHSGDKHPSWKGGRTNCRGYILIYSPGHPYRSKNNRVFEHRLIMEKNIGRYLLPEELVHHKNGIRDDNRPENLIIVYNKQHYGKVICPNCRKEFLIK